MISGPKLLMLSAVFSLLSGFGVAVHAGASQEGCENSKFPEHAEPVGMRDCVDNGDPGKAAETAPEIDGAGALMAIATLGGVLAVVGERRRRRKS